MAWSNKSQKARFQAEKSHSLSFSLRVEDKLHASIIQATDAAFFTVRPVKYLVSFDDSDIVVGTTAIKGNGIRVEGVSKGVGEAQVFQFDVQAAMLNLDAELEYWYDITYVRNGFSLSVAGGEFEVVANVTNRATSSVFTGSGDVHNMIATVDGRNLLTVTASMPLPQKGDPGNGSYVIARPLHETIGGTMVYPLADVIAPAGRAVQVGDIVFSSASRGVMSTVQLITATGTPLVTLMTRQIFGQDALKAMLDIEMHTVPAGSGVNIETVDFAWTCPKAQVPLPPGYIHRVGDMLFSHSSTAGATMTKKLLISLVESVTPTHLNVRTKVVFPMFLDSSDIEELLDLYVPETRKVNGRALTGDISLNADDISEGVGFKKLSSSQANKLVDLPSASALASTLAGKAPSSHSHTIANVTGLDNALAGKVGSSTVSSLWTGTQLQYDAIPVKNNSTIYFIKV